MVRIERIVRFFCFLRFFSVSTHCNSNTNVQVPMDLVLTLTLLASDALRHKQNSIKFTTNISFIFRSKKALNLKRPPWKIQLLWLFDRKHKHQHRVCSTYKNKSNNYYCKDKSTKRSIKRCSPTICIWLNMRSSAPTTIKYSIRAHWNKPFCCR